MNRASGYSLLTALAACLAASGAHADKISHPTAVFAGLDKITGRIINFDVAADETVQFGSLQITPHACYTRPATEAPLTTGFVEVEEVVSNNDNKRIFSGWMFAATPGLHGVEHPVYDVWLTDCKGGTNVIKETVALPQEDVLTPPPPKPGTVPRPRNQQARTPGAPGGPTVPGATGPLDAGNPYGGAPLPTAPTGPGPAAPPAPRRTATPVQPAPPVPVAAAPAPRRSPVQSFFPTAAQPGETARDRARFD